MANPTTNLGMTKPTVGGSTDTWGTTINEEVVDILDALFSISGTDVTMSDIKFNSVGLQETGSGTDTVKLQAPSAVTQYTLTMPGAVGSSGQALRASDGAGVLEWYTPADVGDITSVVAGAGMTGGGSSGAVTLNVIGTADKITVSADALTIASTYVGQTSIVTLGTIATGTWEGTTVAVNQGGTGATSLTDGGILLGSGTGAVTATAVLADGEILIGDGTTDPVALDVGGSTAITILGTVATGVWNGTAIANANLANSTVSYGGVSLALGASDATPAFNLSDATAYTGDSSLVTVGTVASGTWNGTAVGVAYGGTAISSYAAGDILYASGSTTLAKLAKGSDTEVLTLASGVPTWAAPTVGDITGVTAGTGLSGGGTSGTVTLNVEAAQTQITSLGTIGSLVATTADIDGGTFDGIVGGTTPADGSFTTLSASSTLAVTGLSTFSGDIEVAKSAAKITIDSSSSAFLEIDRAATTDAAALIFLTAGSANWVVGTNDSDDWGDGTSFSIATGSLPIAQRLVINGAGNVGIGTISPAAKLDVGGTLAVTGTSTFGDSLVFTGQVDRPAGTVRYITSDGSLLDLATNVPSGGTFTWRIGGSQKMSLNSTGLSVTNTLAVTGDTTLGSTSVNFTAQVQGASLATLRYLDNSAASDEKYLDIQVGTGVSAAYRIRLINDARSAGTNAYVLTRSGTTPLAHTWTGTGSFTGNVGIGTASPTSFTPTLQVSGTDPAFLMQDTATAVDYYAVNVASGAVNIWYDDAADIVWQTATGISGSGLTERMKLSNGGSLTIRGGATIEGLATLKDVLKMADAFVAGTGVHGVVALNPSIPTPQTGDGVSIDYINSWATSNVLSTIQFKHENNTHQEVGITLTTYNSGQVEALKLQADGAATFANNLSVTGTSTLTGNVGIGQSAGNQKVRVTHASAGEAVMQLLHTEGSTPHGLQVDLTTFSGDRTQYIVQGRNSGGEVFNLWSDGGATFTGEITGTSQTLSSTLAVTGNVGIGQSAGSAALEVTGSVVADKVRTDSGTQSCATSTHTTLVGAPDGTLLFSAYIAGEGVICTYIVHRVTGYVQDLIRLIGNGAMTLSLSAENIQAHQTTGSTKMVTWSYLRLDG